VQENTTKQVTTVILQRRQQVRFHKQADKINPGPSPAGVPVVLGPPFEICAPHFMFGPLVAAYIQYCILKMWPPLLLTPGDGPVLTMEHVSAIAAKTNASSGSFAMLEATTCNYSVRIE